jgi:TonB family protein
MFSHLFLHQEFAAWSQWFWPAFANHLWQTTLVVLLAWIATVWLKRVPARTRHAVWLLVFAKLLWPSAALLFVAQFGVSKLTRLLVKTDLPTASFTLVFENAQPLGEFAAPFATVEFADYATRTSHNELYCLLTGVWVLGLSLWLVGWQYRRRLFARTLRSGQPITAGRAFESLQRLREGLSCKRKVALLCVPHLAEPGVWRVWRPMIILPKGMAERLTDAELDALLLHELLHIRHWDNLLATVQMWVCYLCWFHPLVWWLDRRLLAEREWVCDEAVLRRQGTPQIYAASLWKVAQFGLGWPSTNSAGVAGVSRVGGANLKRRIEAMLQNEFPTRLAWPQRLLMGAAITGLAAFSLLIALPAQNGALAQNKSIHLVGNLLADGDPQQGISGGVADGVDKGINGGIAGGVLRGVAGVISAGIATGVEGTKRLQAEPQTQPQDYLAASPQAPINKWDLIEQAPAFSMQIDRTSGAPLVIHQASVKTLLDLDQASSPLSAPEQADKVASLVSQFLLTVTNQASATVKSFEYELQHPGIPAARLKYNPKQNIAPAASLVTGKEHLTHYRIKPGRFTPADFTVRVTSVNYQDGSFWEAGTGFIQSSADKPKEQAFREEIGRLRSQLTQQKQEQEKEEIYEATADLRPVITHRQTADYTQEAIDNQVQGTIILSLVFRRNGKVTDIRVERGLPHGLTAQAIAAAEKVRFEPAVKNGQPVSVRGNMEFRFRLD